MKLKLPNGKFVEKDEEADIAAFFDPGEFDTPCRWAFNLKTGDIEHQKHTGCDVMVCRDEPRRRGPSWVDLPKIDPVDEFRWFSEFVPEEIQDAVEARGLVSASIGILERAGGCRYDWQAHRHERAMEEAVKFLKSIGVEIVPEESESGEGDALQLGEHGRPGGLR